MRFAPRFLLILSIASYMACTPPEYEERQTQEQPQSKPKKLAVDPSLFDTRRDGFSFENYGRERRPLDLTPESVERLCGRSACARGTGASCELSGAMRVFMNDANNSMSEGHCEGISVFTRILQQKHVPLSSIDSRVSSAFNLPFSNRRLQGEIAFYGATMFTSPAGPSERRVTPVQVIEALRANNESYGLGLYMPDRSRGHAVVAIRVVDNESESASIEIYDSIRPGHPQYISVDKTRNTWRYGRYYGDAATKTLTLLPLSPRLVQQRCWASGDDDDDSDDDERISGHRWQLWIDGPGDIEVPKNATAIARRNGDGDSLDPIYLIDPVADVELTLSGETDGREGKARMTVVKQGQSFSLEGLTLAPGQRDKLRLSKDGNGFSYSTSDRETLTFRLGMTYADDDFEMSIEPAPSDGGYAFSLRNTIDMKKGLHVLGVQLANNNGKPASYKVELTRIGDKTTEQFSHRENIKIGPHELHELHYGRWLKDKEPLTITKGRTRLSIADED